MDRKQEDTPQAAASLLHKLILVLDADTDVGDFLAQAVREATPYHAFSLQSGRQALQLVQGVKPDLILLGEYLSDMKSAEISTQLRSLRSLEHVPVLFLSAQRSSREPELPEPPPAKSFIQRIQAALNASNPEVHF